MTLFCSGFFSTNVAAMGASVPLFRSFVGSGSPASNTLGPIAAGTWYGSIGAPNPIIQGDTPTPVYSESNVQKKWQAGVLKNGCILITQCKITTLQRAVAMRSRINGAYGNINVPYDGSSVATGSALVVADATHTDSIAAGDLVNNSIDFGAGTGTALDFIVIPHFGFSFDSTSQTDTWFATMSATATSFSTTPVRYIGLSGLNVQNTVATSANISAAGIWDHLQCNITTAGGTNRTATLDINGSVGNSVIPMTAVGLLEDTTHVDATTAGALVSYAARASAAGSNSAFIGWGVRFKATDANVSILTSVGSAPIGGNSISPGNFWSMQNHLRRNNVAGESRMAIPAAGASSNLSVIIAANTMATDIALSSIKGLANQAYTVMNCVVPIVAGTTGTLTDATHTDSWVAGDNISNYTPQTQNSGTTIQSISLKWTSA